MRSSLVALLIALAACGSTHDLSMGAAPFATVRGKVDLAAVAPTAAGHKLLASIVWGAPPSIHPLCYVVGPAVDRQIYEACPDPFGFFPGTVDATLELDPQGNGQFAFDLLHLPSANVLVGSDVNHVAYATLMVVADLDDNGQVSLVPQRRGGGGRPGSDPQPEPPSDQILAASFVSLQEDHAWLAFREGDFTGLELFYPAPACAAPPLGFSLLQSGAYGAPGAQCEVLDLAQPIALRTLGETEAQAMACRAQRMSTETRQPPPIDIGRAPNFLNGEARCLENKTIAVILGSGTLCPSMTVMALRGCSSDPLCPEPEWDLTKNPPEWWPCK